MGPLGIASLLLVLSAPPASAPPVPDAGAAPLKRWNDGVEAFVQLASGALELAGDDHCRAWVEVTAAQPAPGKAAKVQLHAVRWTMDAERWKGQPPSLVLDGKRVKARVLPRETRGLETVDCAGLAEFVGLELPVSTVARLPAAASAVLIIGRDRIDLKAALGRDLAAFLAALEPARRASGSE